MSTQQAEYEQYTITRDGQPPLRFAGEVIGSSSSRTPDNDTRGTDVTIYRTKGGKFVAEVYRWTRWQGESSRTSAASRPTFAKVIDWLRSENGEILGRISQEAIEDAIRRCPDLRESFVEEVE